MCGNEEENEIIPPADFAQFRPMTKTEKELMGKLMALKMRGEITEEQFNRARVNSTFLLVF